MKKNYFFKTSLLMIPTMAFILMSNSGGKSGAFSGSPGDGGTSCTSCHSGGNFGASVSITHNIPDTGYLLNTNYDVTVTASSSASEHGFQMTAEKVSDDSKIGTLIAGSTSSLTNGNANITHTNASNSSWSFQWKSPSTDEGRVTFFAASVAANGNGTTSGDQVVTGNSGQISSLSIAEAKWLDFEMYPNPAATELNIQLSSGTNEAIVEFYDTMGRLSLSKKIDTSDPQINVSNLSRGVYLLKVLSEDKVGTQKFIKE
ncbi:T9SS type A sorting domain-containing protein [Polaribacter sp.]|nr:T9SS type A sorting domain-containing protein [Polaribacter sp.]